MPVLTPPGEIRLLHAITAMGIGGAQTMLAKLFGAGEGIFARYEQSVLSLMPPGESGVRLMEDGVAVHTLGMRGSVPSPMAVLRLLGLSRGIAPDLFVGWMHHAGLAAYYAAKALHPRRPVIWNVRHSLSDIAHEKATTRAILRHCARLSPQVDAIIFNSHVAKQQYDAFGYATDRAVVIANGFDCAHLQPRHDARAKLARLYPIGGNRPVVGMIARNHPMKDPRTLVEAMRRLWADGMDADLLVVGPGMERLPQSLGRQAFASLPADRFILSGQRLDIAEWLSGLDLLVLPSAWGEAFPNIIGEAMACGVPCVATDTGDAKWIIGEHGCVVPPSDPAALHAAIAGMLDLSEETRRALGLAGRDRVARTFSLPVVARQYAALYDQVIDRWRSRASDRVRTDTAGAA